MNIYALSSGRGPCGIAIIRLSGTKAINIANLITKKKKLNSNSVNHCKFFNPKPMVKTSRVSFAFCKAKKLYRR